MTNEEPKSENEENLDSTDASRTSGPPVAGQATADRVRGIFSTIADRYDLFNVLSSMGFDRHWRRVLADRCELTHGADVLDLASGTGDVALTIAKRRQASRVVATDFVPEMLEVAKQKYARLKASEDISPLEFAVVDAQDIPFADDTFDVVTISFGIRNVPDKAKACREAARVLKPGGRFVVLEFSRPPLAPWRALYYFYLKTVIPFLGGVLTNNRAGFVYLNDSIRLFPNQETFKGILAGNGFSTVDYVNLTGGIVAIHTATK